MANIILFIERVTPELASTIIFFQEGKQTVLKKSNCELCGVFKYVMLLIISSFEAFHIFLRGVNRALDHWLYQAGVYIGGNSRPTRLATTYVDARPE